MKVRWRPLRADCGCYVLRGEVIIKRDGRWICRPCALAAVRATPPQRQETAP